MEVLLFFCVFIGYLCISIHEMSVQIFFSIFMLHYFSLVLIGSSSSCVLNTCICITYTYIPNMMSIHTYIQVSTNLLLHVYRSDYIPRGSDSKESACNEGNPSLIPGLGRSLGEGNGNPLQYSCLENPMGRGAWQATESTGSQRFGHNWATNTFTFRSD